jgi:excisionase family DNA binding protein
MKLTDLLTHIEAADRLKVSRQRVHQLVKKKRLTKAEAFGRQVVYRSEVEALIKELRVSRAKYGPKKAA